ncbi:MAG: hypothetical protein P4L63_00785 [Candidatus Pacebacteria bacterium]|nr:hypothetical protein [Candidatus Paceibacterota bacterium]
MISKHFFKALTAFLTIIVIGLISFIIINSLSQNSGASTIPASQVQVAK